MMIGHHAQLESSASLEMGYSSPRSRPSRCPKRLDMYQACLSVELLAQFQQGSR
jgi:hypothetical protein